MIRYLLLKSEQLGFNFGTSRPNHISYTRTNQRGTASRIAQRGNPHAHQLGLDFSRPLPPPPPPPPPPKPKTITELKLTPLPTAKWMRDATSGRPTKLAEPKHKILVNNGKAVLEFMAPKVAAALDAYEAFKKDYESAKAKVTKLYDKGASHRIITAANDELDMRERLSAASRIRVEQEINNSYHSILKHLQEQTPFYEAADAKDQLTKDMMIGLDSNQEQAITKFYQIIGTDKTPTLKFIKDDLVEGERASANPAGWFTMNRRTADNTIMHEMGHHIEMSHPEITEASCDFVIDRCRRHYKATTGRNNIELKPLKELVPGSNYKDGESAWVDNFVSPYVGKDYGRHYSEVVSMGMQQFSSRYGLTRFAQDDPEHFHFMLGMIHYIQTKPVKKPKKTRSRK
jgi:hypothetical protein